MRNAVIAMNQTEASRKQKNGTVWLSFRGKECSMSFSKRIPRVMKKRVFKIKCVETEKKTIMFQIQMKFFKKENKGKSVMLCNH